MPAPELKTSITWSPQNQSEQSTSIGSIEIKLLEFENHLGVGTRGYPRFGLAKRRRFSFHVSNKRYKRRNFITGTLLALPTLSIANTIGFKKKETKAEISRELHDEFKDKKLKKDLSTIQAIRMGFLTNALNPKATLFFVALFTQIINPNTALGIKVLYGAEMSVATFVWFAVVASALTHRRINRLFLGVRTHLERVFGVILVGLGISVALDLRK